MSEILSTLRRAVDVSTSDEFIKPTFDYLRNIGLVAVLFAAAGWIHTNPRSGGSFFYFDMTSGFVIGIVGLILYILNMHNFTRKIRSLSASPWLHIFSIGMNGFLAAWAIIFLGSR